MTSEDVRSEIEREPFIPLRLHLVSGKTVDVLNVNDAAVLQNSVMIFPGKRDRLRERDYHIVALRNIERIERISNDEALNQE